MNELDKLRGQIDEADREIAAAFEKRMRCAEGVARYKREHGMAVLDASREEALLKKRAEALKNKEYSHWARRLFRFLMKLSREYQRGLLAGEPVAREPRADGKVAFQGEDGANSQAAAKLYFGDNAATGGYPLFEDVFGAVQRGDAAYGVLPIENSDTGSITRVYDLLSEYGMYIVGEQYLPIDHKLLAPPGASLAAITDVYSHEQALLQCSEYLKEKPFTQHPYFNTAVSARYVAGEKDGTKAAIASAYAARLYGLAILEEDISNSEENTTRFIVIAGRPYRGEHANKASVCFVLDHHAGALAKALRLFAERNLNMVKIESRPLFGRNFEYIFYVDFAGSVTQEGIVALEKESGGVFREFSLLGLYESRGIK